MGETTIRNKDELARTLQEAVDAENMLHFCLSHPAFLIKNGRIRNKFNFFAEIAKANKKFLITRLKDLGINRYLPEKNCRFCSVKAESFSLLGALNLGLEVIDIQIKLYKDLLKLTSNLEDRKRFKQILNKKSEQNKFLKKEKKFA